MAKYCFTLVSIGDIALSGAACVNWNSVASHLVVFNISKGTSMFSLLEQEWLWWWKFNSIQKSAKVPLCEVSCKFSVSVHC